MSRSYSRGRDNTREYQEYTGYILASLGAMSEVVYWMRVSESVTWPHIYITSFGTDFIRNKADIFISIYLSPSLSFSRI